MLTQEMKRHAVIVALTAKHTDLEISNFLNVARSLTRNRKTIDEMTGGYVQILLKYPR